MSAPVVERDYVLTHIIEGLTLLPSPPGLVFKGGTALRLCFFERYRYSADLDFSLVGVTEAEALELIESALRETQDRVGIPRLEFVEDRRQEIQYEGPLGRARAIKLDLVADELVIETQQNSILIRYADQVDAGGTLTTYTLDEITAEKLRCVIQRLQCRDPFDLHRLLTEEGVEMDVAWQLFEQKALHKGLDPATFDQRLDDREPQYRARWEHEIAEHAGEAPPFDRFIRELRRALRQRS